MAEYRKNSDFYQTSDMTKAAVILVKTGKEPNVDRDARGFRFYFDDSDGSIAWLMGYGVANESIGLTQLFKALTDIRRGISETFGRR